MMRLLLLAFSICVLAIAQTTKLSDISNGEDITETEEKQLQEQTNSPTSLNEAKQTGTFWQAPDFSNQNEAIGWSPAAFEIPPGFQQRVKFWIDIYTKFTTHQALLHDAHYLDIVYKIVDFTDIDSDPKLSLNDKEKTKKKRIKEEKKLIKEQLLRIQKLEDSPSLMSADDLAVFKKFRYVNETKKFLQASSRNRLRMQLGQKDRFTLGVYYSGRYIREMERIFREERVPIELTRLPFVESSFNLYAFSRRGASGIWQFMRSTGRLYLKIDGTIDLRNDPLTATRAAARLLRANYKLLGSWSLALTGYNHGPQGVSRIVKKLKTDDINEIVWNTTRRKFGFASENFYAEFLAALEVESHAAKYFGKVEVSPPLEYDQISLPQNMTFPKLAKAMAPLVSQEQAKGLGRLYNPFFTPQVLSGRRPISKGFIVRVPKNQRDRVLAEMTAER